jgi:hypothetical protein
MLKFSKNDFFQIKNIVKDNIEYFKNIPLVEMIFSKLFNYSMDKCWNGQGTTVMYFFAGFFVNLTL